MMDAKTHYGYSRIVRWLAPATLGLLLAAVTGCPADDTASMAQQMGQARPGASRANQPPPALPAGDQQPTGDTPSGMQMSGSAEEPAADPGEPAAGDPGEQPCGDAPEEPEYDGPVVLVDQLVVKPPYPEFDGQGRYSVSFEAKLEEPHPAGVWNILAFDAEGAEVASIEEFMTISSGRPKSLNFRGLFCTSKPDSVEIRLTDKEPVKPGGEGAEESEQSGGSGRGAAGLT